MSYLSDVMCGGAAKGRNLKSVSVPRLPYTPVIAGMPVQLVETNDATLYAAPPLALFGHRFYETDLSVIQALAAFAWDADAATDPGAWMIPFELTDGTMCAIEYSFTSATNRAVHVFNLGDNAVQLAEVQTTTNQDAATYHGIFPVGTFSGYFYAASVDSDDGGTTVCVWKVDLSDGSAVLLVEDTEAMGPTAAQPRWTRLPGGDADSVKFICADATTGEVVSAVVFEVDINGSAITIVETNGLDLTTLDAGFVASGLEAPVVVGSDDELYFIAIDDGSVWMVHLEVNVTTLAVTFGTNSIEATVTTSSLSNPYWLKDLMEDDVWYLFFASGVAVQNALIFEPDFTGGTMTCTRSTELTFGGTDILASDIHALCMSRKLYSHGDATDEGVYLLDVAAEGAADSGSYITYPHMLAGISGFNGIAQFNWIGHQPDIYAANGMFLLSQATAVSSFCAMVSPWGFKHAVEAGVPRIVQDKDLSTTTPIAHAWTVDASTVLVDKNLTLGVSGAYPAGVSTLTAGGFDYLKVDWGGGSDAFRGVFGLVDGYNSVVVGNEVVYTATGRTPSMVVGGPFTFAVAETPSVQGEVQSYGGFTVSSATGTYLTMEVRRCF